MAGAGSNWLGIHRRRDWREPQTEATRPDVRAKPRERTKQRVIRLQDQLPVVIFDPLRCPECGSKKLRTHTVRPPKRNHECKECGAKFKSIEEDHGEPT